MTPQNHHHPSLPKTLTKPFIKYGILRIAHQFIDGYTRPPIPLWAGNRR